jgi:hypothetical protein
MSLGNFPWVPYAALCEVKFHQSAVRAVPLSSPAPVPQYDAVIPGYSRSFSIKWIILQDYIYLES